MSMYLQTHNELAGMSWLVASALKRLPWPTAPRRFHKSPEERTMSWKWKPSSHTIGGKDSIVQPALQCLVTKSMGSAVLELDGHRVGKQAQPDVASDLIRRAANLVLLQKQRKVHRTWVSEPKRDPGKAQGEAPLQTSADLVRAYSALLDALTATILNAEAASNWLGTQPPNLAGVRRTLGTIAKDGKRAGEIAVRLRTLMQDNALDPQARSDPQHSAYEYTP